MERRRRTPITAVIAVGCLAVAAACDAATTTDQHEEIPPPTVIATTAIWGDIVNQATCDELVEVDWVIPNRSDPRTHVPSARGESLLDEADLIVATSFDYETELAGKLRTLRAQGTPVLQMAEEVETIGDDLSVWLDPSRTLQLLDVLVEALIELGVDEGALRECAGEYAREVDFLDQDLAAVFEALPEESHLVIADTPELVYFTERYDLELYVVDLSEGRLDFVGEVPERILEREAAEAELGPDDDPLPPVTVFSDEEPIADLDPDIDVVRLRLHSLEPLPEGGTQSYVDTMRANGDEITLVEIGEL